MGDYLIVWLMYDIRGPLPRLLQRPIFFAGLFFRLGRLVGAGHQVNGHGHSGHATGNDRGG